MTSRVWHAWTTPQDADKYEALLKEEIFIGIQGQHIRGFQQAVVPDKARAILSHF